MSFLPTKYIIHTLSHCRRLPCTPTVHAWSPMQNVPGILACKERHRAGFRFPTPSLIGSSSRCNFHTCLHRLWSRRLQDWSRWNSSHHPAPKTCVAYRPAMHPGRCKNSTEAHINIRSLISSYVHFTRTEADNPGTSTALQPLQSTRLTLGSLRSHMLITPTRNNIPLTA